MLFSNEKTISLCKIRFSQNKTRQINIQIDVPTIHIIRIWKRNNLIHIKIIPHITNRLA